MSPSSSPAAWAMAVAPSRTSAGVFGMTRIIRVPGGRCRRISLVDTPAATEMRSFPGVGGRDLVQHGAEDLRLHGEEDHVGPPDERHVVRGDAHPVEPLQLIEPLGPDVGHHEVLGGHEPRLGETPDEGLAHVAATHEPDPLVPDGHGQSSRPSATPVRRALKTQAREPKIAVPTRTIVAPSSTPTSKSPLMPMDSSARSGPWPQRRASSSSFRISL